MESQPKPSRNCKRVETGTETKPGRNRKRVPSGTKSKVESSLNWLESKPNRIPVSGRVGPTRSPVILWAFRNVHWIQSLLFCVQGFKLDVSFLFHRLLNFYPLFGFEPL